MPAVINQDLVQSVSDFLFLEAALLDQKLWHEWLDLYSPEVEFWIPAWDSQDDLVTDPKTQISLIYYGNRDGLEDRVFRIESGTSLASRPLPRTCHMISNIRVVARHQDGSCEVHSNWQTNSYKLSQSHSYYGFYEHDLKPQGNRWIITRKKIVVLNDTLPDTLDIYSV